MTLNNTAKNAIRDNNRVMARLMILYNRGTWTIIKWLKADDPRLTLPAAMEILTEETGCSREQLLESSAVLA